MRGNIRRALITALLLILPMGLWAMDQQGTGVTGDFTVYEYTPNSDLLDQNTIGKDIVSEEGRVQNPFQTLFAAFDKIFRSMTMGACIAALFIWRLVAAYGKIEENPHAPKKALVQFVVTVLVIEVAPEIIMSLMEPLVT